MSIIFAFKLQIYFDRFIPIMVIQQQNVILFKNHRARVILHLQLNILVPTDSLKVVYFFREQGKYYFVLLPP